MPYSHEQQKELVMKAQHGDKEALMQLWESVYLLLFRMCLHCYNSMREQADRFGVTSDDFMQISYFAFLDAVKGYDPERGFAFTSYFKYPLKNHIHSLLGVRSSRRDALNHCSSLNELLSEDDPDSGERIDLVPDPTDDYEPEELRIYREQLHEDLERCLSTLEEREQRVIRSRYWDGKTLKEVGQEIGVSYQRVRDIERHGFFRMRKDKRLQVYRNEILETSAYSGTGLSSFRHSGSSSVERTAEIIEHIEQVEQERDKWLLKMRELGVNIPTK